MQFDWMVQCYAGAGVHRDSPLLESVDRETVMTGVDAAVDVDLEGCGRPDSGETDGPRSNPYCRL